MENNSLHPILRSSRFKSLMTLSFLFMVILAVNFLSMPSQIYVGDSVAVRYSTKNFLTSGLLDVPHDTAVKFGEKGQYFYENIANHKWYPKYGVMNTFMYIPPMLAKLIVAGQLEGELYKEDPLILNIYNIFLSLIIAFFLYKISSFYTRNRFIKIVFILLAFYATFLWHYMRAQSFEIFQLLFFIIFYYFLLKFKNDKENGSGGNLRYYKNIIYSEIFLLFLCLTKTIFVLLIPVVIFYCLWIEGGFSYQTKNILTHLKENFIRNRKVYLIYVLLPTAIILSVILFFNSYRYGSPFTLGYGQWSSRNDRVFSGNVFLGMYGFLFDAQRSIFIYFPILLFSLFGLKKFFKKNSTDTILSSFIFFIFLFMYSSVENWKGEWSYGPRYLLFILPVLSLPFIDVMHWILENYKKIKIKIIAIVISGILVYSLSMQIYVNSLDFFTFYRLRSIFNQLSSVYVNGEVNEVLDVRQKVQDYFQVSNFGKINKDYLRFIKYNKSFSPLDQIKPFLKSDTEVKDVETFLKSYNKYNYYWF